MYKFIRWNRPTVRCIKRRYFESLRESAWMRREHALNIVRDHDKYVHVLCVGLIRIMRPMLRKQLSTTAILETFEFWKARRRPKCVSLRSLLVFDGEESGRDVLHKVLALSCLPCSKHRLETSMHLVDGFAHLCGDDAKAARF